LAELLTVLAIMALLAGLLFPVFLSAKGAAKKAQCLSNMRQTFLATASYMSDYDDTFMPVNHRPAMPPNARYDRTWVQLILPYAASFSIFTCPSDSSVREEDTLFDQDLVPGDIYARYYTASMRVTMGYNYVYLSPVVFKHGQWVSDPKTASSVGDPSKTLLYVDSINDRLPSGTPYGGGSWIVIPPCRYDMSTGSRRDSFGGDGTIFTPYIGWKVSETNSARIYGNAWPWHFGRINVARVDGSVKSLSVSDLTAGCNVQDLWRGSIKDDSQYVWDIH
jgi:type II secretory pathway pseudopilin PulG